MLESLASQHPAERRPTLSRPLVVTAAVAVAALLARHADGTTALPTWLVIALQLPALLAWGYCGYCRFGNVKALGASASRSDAWLTLIAVAGAAGLALGFRRVEVFFAATTAFIAGQLLIDVLSRRYRRLDELIACPADLLSNIIGPWLVLIVLATILLSLPLATHSAVPDYRHNFWDHVLNNAFAAVGSAGLVGSTIYSFGTEYSLFGQAVLVVTVQLAGLGFAVIGLAVIRPFLTSSIRLRTVLRWSVVLQLLGIAAMWSVWQPCDTPSAWDRLWWSVVHAGGAFWNCGLTMRGDGLAAYVWKPAVFASITTLSIVGSLGLPLILDLILGRRSTKRNVKAEPRLAATPPWLTLPQWEAGLAFAMLLIAAVVLWSCETPWRHDIVWRLPETWIPARPVDLGTSQLSLRDEMPLPRRWTLAVFVSATLRSSGMQSVPVMEGTLSWPSYGLLLSWMFVGGSIGGVAGGLRTTTMLLPMLCLLARRSGWNVPPGGEAGRRLLLRAGLYFVPLWLALNLASVGLVSLVSDGTLYERFFESVAACNSVGLSTGLSLHLTWSGRVVMILVMTIGRVLPVAYWLRTSRRFTECLRSTRA